MDKEDLTNGLKTQEETNKQINLGNPVNLNINHKPPNKLKLKTPGQKTQDRDTPLGC